MDFDDPAIAQAFSEAKAAMTSRLAPSQTITRAGTMLRMVKQGLRDMQEADQDRILLGFLGVVVFGRSVTLVMQNLRTHGRHEFDTWYSPWQEEMQRDALLRYFSDLRTKVIHQHAPAIGILLSTSDRSGPPIGSITIDDSPLPETHLGQPLDDRSMSNLCRLYLAYLERMFAAFAPVAFSVQDRLLEVESQRDRSDQDGAA